MFELQVFFPIHNRGHFYGLLFNLTNPEHIIIDNIRYTKKVEDVYGEIPKLVVNVSCINLKTLF